MENVQTPLKMYFLLKMGIFHCYVSLEQDAQVSETEATK